MPKDIQGVRNIDDIKKVYEGTFSRQEQFSYSDLEKTVEKNKKREVGEVWEEINPVTGQATLWEQKKGYRVKKSKNADTFADVRNYLRSFPNCQKETCTCTAPNRLDKKFRNLTGMCADCHFSYETKLKIEGKYEEYEQNKIKQNVLSFLRDAEHDVNTLIESITKTEVVNDDGSVEKWEIENKEAVVKKIRTDWIKFKNQYIREYKLGLDEEE